MKTALTFPKHRKLFLTSKTILLSSLLFISLHFSPAQQSSRFELPKSADVPGYKLQVMMEMRGESHRQFGSWVAGLGDVNKDGGNDFAVSTGGDTTFIYFGGKGILDDVPDLFVLGGASKIVAADFNGDGWIDIATSASILRAEKSVVRIYLNNKTPTVFNSTPDAEMKGSADKELGREMLAGDFDADGKSDLLVQSYGEFYVPQKGKVYLFFGNAQLSAIPDFTFQVSTDTIKTGGQTSFGKFIQVGDYNNDNIHDIVIQAELINYNPLVRNYKIFFGNSARKFDVPDYDLSGKFYPFIDERIYLVDINGEKKDELHFTNFTSRELSVVWGRSNGIPVALPDTIFPNPEPGSLRYAQKVFECSDMNGDQFPDYVVSYVAYLNALVLYVYRGGPGWNKNAMAYLTLDQFAFEYWKAIVPIGDIDGDGAADLAAFRDVPTPAIKPLIQIYKGDRRITGVQEPESTLHDFSLKVFPNPVSSNATIEYRLPVSSRITLKLYDILGRLITVLDEGEKQAGSYQLSIDNGLLTTQTVFCVLATEGKNKIERITILGNPSLREK